MGETYLCQMVDHDDADQWTPVSSWDAQGAATAYADDCDRDSAGELFTDPSRSKQTIRVRRPDDTLEVFDITFDYSKDFYAARVDRSGR